VQGEQMAREEHHVFEREERQLIEGSKELFAGTVAFRHGDLSAGLAPIGSATLGSGLRIEPRPVRVKP